MHMHTLHGELVISIINTSKFFNTFSQLNTWWDAVAIFNQAIWVCDLKHYSYIRFDPQYQNNIFFHFLKNSLGELRKTNDWNF